jgi:hypothetical protein
VPSRAATQTERRLTPIHHEIGGRSVPGASGCSDFRSPSTARPTGEVDFASAEPTLGEIRPTLLPNPDPTRRAESRVRCFSAMEYRFRAVGAEVLRPAGAAPLLGTESE